jgi:hypothetical protein
MVERKRSGDELREEFSVLGSTGNVRVPLFFLRSLRSLEHRSTLSPLIRHHPATACRVFFHIQLTPNSGA